METENCSTGPVSRHFLPTSHCMGGPLNPSNKVLGPPGRLLRLGSAWLVLTDEKFRSSQPVTVFLEL